MEIIKRLSCGELNCIVDCVVVSGMYWFRGKDVAIALGYADTKRALQLHVEDEDKHKLEELRGDKNDPLTLNKLTINQLATFFINESGLYSLIFNSNKETAKTFKHWVTHEVLPTLRQTGTYATSLNTPIHQQFKLMNEYDLHVKVIGFIRRFRDDAIIVPGLGELQYNTSMRHESYLKGYLGGQPDILILNNHIKYTGLAIELKTPKGNGVVSTNQINYLTQLKTSGYKVIISNDYDDIIVQLIDYFYGIRYKCVYCSVKCGFKTLKTLEQHHKTFHKLMYQLHNDPSLKP